MKIKYKTYALKRQERETKLSKWHNWFAWYPVRINERELAWLQTVKRKAFCFTNDGKVAIWVNRP